MNDLNLRALSHTVQAEQYFRCFNDMESAPSGASFDVSLQISPLIGQMQFTAQNDEITPLIADEREMGDFC